LGARLELRLVELRLVELRLLDGNFFLPPLSLRRRSRASRSLLRRWGNT